MQNTYSQFNKKTIEQIKNFCTSSNDIFLFYAPSGTGKNDILNIALRELKSDFLYFYYCCNSLTVIEDFLLGFYDTLRDYTIQKKIILKKDLSDNFTQKVSNYMKALTQDTLIVVDNFEKIKEDESINNFLINISKQEKTKLILLSRTDVSLDKFELNGLKTIKIQKEFVDEDGIIQKMSFACPMEELGTIRSLYQISHANTILLKTTFKYIDVTNTSLSDLIDEFNKKPQAYENFITGKALSLIPQNYMSSIKVLSLSNFLTPLSYLEKYALFDVNYIPYLQQRLIINQVKQNIYVHEHIKAYLSQNMSVAEKIRYGDIIIDSLSKEISKGPKDRILRLSREGIRKQIELLEENIPRINPNAPTNTEVSYYTQVQNVSAPWLNQSAIPSTPKINEAPQTPNQEDLEMLKQFRQSHFEDKVQEEEKIEIDKASVLREKIKEYEDKFDFKGAISSLKELSLIDKKNENKIFEKIAENYRKLNKKEDAISYYVKASDNYKNKGNKEKYFAVLLKIADTYFKTYDLERAGKIYHKIANEDTDNKNIVEAYIALGSIEEKRYNEDEALKYYNQALRISNETNLTEKTSEIYYFIASIFEKQNKTNDAKKYYQISIECGKNNAVLADSYLALASLLFDENNTKDAVYNYEMAISKYEQDKKPKATSLYNANINLAYIFKAMGSDKEEKYLKEALKWASMTNDMFEIATSYIALGDYYYNLSSNKEALLNYLRAKDSLNEDKNSQNHRMISSRIEDMKYKLGTDFIDIVKEYEQTKN